jgi:pseudouridine-5'-phosphate glycosidase
MDRDMDGVSEEVAATVRAGAPVVALESTLVTHGLPWPVNLETAEASEAAVRAAGAVPATVAVVRGRAWVGLGHEELERLAREGAAGAVRKASRRDLGAAVAAGVDAGTTVSATLHLARRAGVAVMATGGIGGVHRGAGETFDVSSDLDEIARADGCLLVCSGAKSILDLPATLEALETRGVGVVGYRTSAFPEFTSGEGVLPLSWRVESPEEAAGLVAAHRARGVPGAVVLCRAAEPALDRAGVEAALAAALAEAGRRGVRGPEVTPLLLDAMRVATGGRSLEVNGRLIVENAALAAAVAVAISGRAGPG